MFKSTRATIKSFMVIVQSQNEMDLSKQQQLWRDILEKMDLDIHFVDIRGMNMEQSITAAIEASLELGIDCLAMESVSTICKTTFESAKFAQGILACGKRLFILSPDFNLNPLIEINEEMAENLKKVEDETFLSLDTEDIPFALLYLSGKVTMEILIDYLENLSLKAADWEKNEETMSSLAQEIRRAVILARHIEFY